MLNKYFYNIIFLSSFILSNYLFGYYNFFIPFSSLISNKLFIFYLLNNSAFSFYLINQEMSLDIEKIMILAFESWGFPLNFMMQILTNFVVCIHTCMPTHIWKHTQEKKINYEE